MAVDLVTVAQLRRRAFATVAPIEAVLGTAETDLLLAEVLAEAKAGLEQTLETFWEHKVIRQSTPDEGDLYDVTESPLPYYRGQFKGYNLPMWVLNRRPVVSIEQIRLQFGEEQVVLTSPEAWYRLDQRLGVISLMPIGTQALIAASSGAWFLPLLGQFHPFNAILQFTVVDYTAGWYDPDGDALPTGSEEVRKGILASATLGLLDAGDGIIPQSASAGGSSQNFSSVAERTKRAKEGVAEFKAWWNSHYRPPRMVMI